MALAPLATQSGSSPSTALNYQSGVQVGPATNIRALKSLIDAPTHTVPGSRTGQSAAQLFGRQNRLNDWGQMSNAAQAANSQNIMAAQKLRSEATISGVQNLTHMYSDFNDRNKAAAMLNADVQASNIGFQMGAQASAARRAMNIWRGNP
jgi:hypothetical protein